MQLDTATEAGREAGSQVAEAAEEVKAARAKILMVSNAMLLQENVERQEKSFKTHFFGIRSQGLTPITPPLSVMFGSGLFCFRVLCFIFL